MRTYTQQLAGWGNYPLVSTQVMEPSEITELPGQNPPPSLIARGLGRSYADQATNSQAATLLCTRLNRFLVFNPQTGVLTCQAGVSLDEIIRTFTPQGWFPMITPGTKYVTIGGAIANDVHGKAHHVDGTFVNCVDSFKICLADGTVRTCSRTENADLFWANFGGLGLLGIILEATIRLRRIQTSYFRQKAIRARHLEEMMDAIDTNDREYNYSVAWIDPLARGKHLGRGVLTVGNHAEVAELPSALAREPLKVLPPAWLKVPFYLPDFSLNGLTVIFLNKAIDFVQSHAQEFSHYEKFFYPLDAIGQWNYGYGRRGFTQYQFVIPPENSRANIRAILEQIASSGCVPFLNVLKKFGPEQGMLSFPTTGYTFAIDFPITRQLPAFLRKLDRMVLQFGGRIYLGKDAFLHREDFEPMYPRLAEWKAIKRTYDPRNRFSSDIARRLGLAEG